MAPGEPEPAHDRGYVNYLFKGWSSGGAVALMNRDGYGQGDPEYRRTGRVNGGNHGRAQDPHEADAHEGGSSPEPAAQEPLASIQDEEVSPVQPPHHPFLSRCQRVALALLIGFGLTLLQLGGVLAFAPGVDEAGRAVGLSERWGSLFQHDSFWFENIMKRGYASPVPPAPYKSFEVSNVAFFPGYPLLAGFLKDRWGIGYRDALLLTALVSAGIFWSYAIGFLMRWRVPWLWAGMALAMIAAHPAALFMVAAYSESLFLAMLLGFLFWSSRAGKTSAVLAAVHGFGMTATRIVGIPCAFASGGGGRIGGGFLRRLERRFWITFVAVLGAALFFAFCQARFGSWDFYMQTQEAGWGIKPELLEPLRRGHYTRLVPDWTQPRQVSQFSMAVTAWMVGLMGVAELLAQWQARRRSISAELRVRLPFYFCAAAIFYLSAAGVASVGFESMVRYQFCTWVLGVLAAAHLFAVVPPQGRMVRGVLCLMAVLLIAACWWLQGIYAGVFTRGGWFA